MASTMLRARLSRWVFELIGEHPLSGGDVDSPEHDPLWTVLLSILADAAHRLFCKPRLQPAPRPVPSPHAHCPGQEAR
jgi:hypothetical protein